MSGVVSEGCFVDFDWWSFWNKFWQEIFVVNLWWQLRRNHRYPYVENIGIFKFAGCVRKCVSLSTKISVKYFPVRTSILVTESEILVPLISR